MFPNHNFHFILILLLAMLLSGCRLTPQPRLLEAETTNWVTGDEETIAITWITVDEQLLLPEQFSNEVEADLHNFLAEEGYQKIITQKEYSNLYESISSSMDIDFFDTISGQLDHQAYNLFLSLLMSEFLQQYQPDVLLSIRIFKTIAEYDGHKAFWDNIEDRTVYQPNFLLDRRSGTMPAISIEIKAYNVLTNTSYTRTQGLQTIIVPPGYLEIHPEDINLHLQNIRLGLHQLSVK